MHACYDDVASISNLEKLSSLKTKEDLLSWLLHQPWQLSMEETLRWRSGCLSWDISSLLY